MIFDRLKDARSFNPNVTLYAKEITMLARAANAGGIEIRDEDKKNVAFGLGEELLKAIKTTKHLGEGSAAVDVVNAAVKALGVGFIPGHVIELRWALLAAADRDIERDGPNKYGFTARMLKASLQTLGLDFTEELKDRFYPKMLGQGLTYIYNADNGLNPDHRCQLAGNLIDGLAQIGAPESSIAVEKIRLASVLARADIREYREAQIAKIQAEAARLSLRGVVSAP